MRSYPGGFQWISRKDRENQILEAHFPFFRQITDYSMISTATENPIGIESAEPGHRVGGPVRGLIFSYWRVLKSRNGWNTACACRADPAILVALG